MPRNASVILGEQIKAGRFELGSEAVRAAMRLLEEHEQKVAALRRALIEGEDSGEPVAFDIEDVISEARREAGC